MGFQLPNFLSATDKPVSLYATGIFEDETAGDDTPSVFQPLISKLLDRKELSTKLGETRLLSLPEDNGVSQLLIVGLGKRGELNAARFQRAAAAIGKALKTPRVDAAVIHLHRIEVPGRDTDWTTRITAVACAAGLYTYTATKAQAEKRLSPIGALVFPNATEQSLHEAKATATGVLTARELGNLPPNILYPEAFAQRARKIAERHDSLEIEVLDRAQIEAEKMGSLLGVAAGSAHDPRLIVLKHKSSDTRPPIVLVGKGITFDTGGISIKPGKDMDEMKYDMCGAAAVVGAIEAAAMSGIERNVVAVVPAVENMPDGKAYRPGDVLTSRSGKTIEVLNTDAEGRLILCDALDYAKDRFQPAALVDVATLTGACVIALGHEAAGLMSEDEELAADLLRAGEQAADRAWRLPLWEEYQPLLDTSFADVANIGGPAAGTITAGCFLARFAEGARYAHLDIAGVAWEKKADGASGRPVALLVEYLRNQA